MATRCLIAIPLENGVFVSAYCHWDGYPDGVGATLKEHYTEYNKIMYFILQGAMSSIDKNGNAERYFDMHDNDADIEHSRRTKSNLPQVHNNLFELKSWAFQVNAEFVYIWAERYKQWDAHDVGPLSMLYKKIEDF